MMTGNFTCENTTTNFCRFLRLIGVNGVIVILVLKRYLLHKYLLFYYHCSFRSFRLLSGLISFNNSNLITPIRQN